MDRHAAADTDVQHDQTQQYKEQLRQKDEQISVLQRKLEHFRSWLQGLQKEVQAKDPQILKNARRLYIGGIPEGTKEDELRTFFEGVMSSTGACIGPGTPIATCKISTDKSYAFLEMRSVEEASNAMAFDGIVFRDTNLKIRRPSNYSAADAGPLGPTAPDPTLDTSHLPMCKTVVEDSWNKIFVGGLPCNYGDEQVKELLQPYGSLKSFNLVMDKNTGKSKGYAFCEFTDPRVIPAVINGLHMQCLERKVLTVKRALEGNRQGGGGKNLAAPLGAPPGGSSSNLDRSGSSGLRHQHSGNHVAAGGSVSSSSSSSALHRQDSHHHQQQQQQQQQGLNPGGGPFGGGFNSLPGQQGFVPGPRYPGGVGGQNPRGLPGGGQNPRSQHMHHGSSGGNMIGEHHHHPQQQQQAPPAPAAAAGGGSDGGLGLGGQNPSAGFGGFYVPGAPMYHNDPAAAAATGSFGNPSQQQQQQGGYGGRGHSGFGARDGNSSSTVPGQYNRQRASTTSQQSGSEQQLQQYEVPPAAAAAAAGGMMYGAPGAFNPMGVPPGPAAAAAASQQQQQFQGSVMYGRHGMPLNPRSHPVMLNTNVPGHKGVPPHPSMFNNGGPRIDVGQYISPKQYGPGMTNPGVPPMTNPGTPSPHLPTPPGAASQLLSLNPQAVQPGGTKGDGGGTAGGTVAARSASLASSGGSGAFTGLGGTTGSTVNGAACGTASSPVAAITGRINSLSPGIGGGAATAAAALGLSGTGSTTARSARPSSTGGDIVLPAVHPDQAASISSSSSSLYHHDSMPAADGAAAAAKAAAVTAAAIDENGEGGSSARAITAE